MADSMTTQPEPRSATEALRVACHEYAVRNGQDCNHDADGLWDCRDMAGQLIQYGAATPDAPAPAVVPDVEAAWEALVDGLDAVNSRSFGMRYIVARHRPLIEAAIRAEGRGALDVEALRDALIVVARSHEDLRSTPTAEAQMLAREYAALLAQREPAESQPDLGPDPGTEVWTKVALADEPAESQGPDGGRT